MISPTIAAIIAATSTAPAAVSLATLASGFRSVVTKSTTDSIAVLTSSRAVSYTHLDVYKRQLHVLSECAVTPPTMLWSKNYAATYYSSRISIFSAFIL